MQSKINQFCICKRYFKLKQGKSYNKNKMANHRLIEVFASNIGLLAESAYHGMSAAKV